MNKALNFNHNLVDTWKIFLELIKFRIALLTTLSMVTGFILAGGKLSLNSILLSGGVFLLAGGSLTLNQYQDRKIDAMMERTKLRPIPAGKISPKTALILSIILIFSGFFIILFSSNLLSSLLGLLAIIWYNIIYYVLKRKTEFAIIPGSLVGTIPPVIGWVAGGGKIYDLQIIILASFLFIWQIPHFWLLLIKYRNDYENSHLPSLTKTYSTEQLTRITFMWILATAEITILMPLFGICKSIFVFFCMLILACWLIVTAIKFLKYQNQNISFNFILKDINIFAFLLLMLLSLEKLLLFK